MALRVEGSEQARDDVRSLDKTTAMSVFDGLLRYARSGHGDVKTLQGALQGRLRLRVGDYRIFFSVADGVLRVHALKNRKNAYLD